MHAWFAMSLGAAGRVNQRPMLRDILIQDMGMGIDLRPNGNGRASALPASEKRVTADSIGCAVHVRYWPTGHTSLRRTRHSSAPHRPPRSAPHPLSKHSPELVQY